jgi:hypothetical protein
MEVTNIAVVVANTVVNGEAPPVFKDWVERLGTLAVATSTSHQLVWPLSQRSLPSARPVYVASSTQLPSHYSTLSDLLSTSIPPHS